MPKIFKWILITFVSLFVVIFIVGTFLPPVPPKGKAHTSKTNGANNFDTFSISTQNFNKYFGSQWDSIQLKHEGRIPLYGDYFNALDSVLKQMDLVIVSIPDSSHNVKKLKKEFTRSKKYKTAYQNYRTFGQPGYDGELYAPCMSTFEVILNDPSSLDVIDRSVKGQSKKGWIVVMMYRAVNAFGARVIQRTTFDVRFNVKENGFYVNSYN